MVCQAKANENITNPELFITLSESDDVNQTTATTTTKIKTILFTSKNRGVFCLPFLIAENQ